MPHVMVDMHHVCVLRLTTTRGAPYLTQKADFEKKQNVQPHERSHCQGIKKHIVLQTNNDMLTILGQTAESFIFVFR